MGVRKFNIYIYIYIYFAEQVGQFKKKKNA